MPWNDPRPMSPHLQVYKLPMTAVLSILHRATGVVLFFGALGLVMILLMAMMGEQTWLLVQGVLGSWLGYLALAGMSFSLYYHLCNGIRHLFWDIGMGFDPKRTQQSGIAVIVSSVTLTSVTCLMAWL